MSRSTAAREKVIRGAHATDIPTLAYDIARLYLSTGHENAKRNFPLFGQHTPRSRVPRVHAMAASVLDYYFCLCSHATYIDHGGEPACWKYTCTRRRESMEMAARDRE